MGPHGTWLSRSAKVIWFVSIGPRPFVANSEIAEVAVKSPHLIFVVGKKPGVTTLYAVDQNENVLASLRLVVTHSLTELQEALLSVIPQGRVTLHHRGTW